MTRSSCGSSLQLLSYLQWLDSVHAFLAHRVLTFPSLSILMRIVSSTPVGVSQMPGFPNSSAHCKRLCFPRLQSINIPSRWLYLPNYQSSFPFKMHILFPAVNSAFQQACFQATSAKHVRFPFLQPLEVGERSLSLAM